jgi:hypothetical protein
VSVIDWLLEGDAAIRWQVRLHAVDQLGLHLTSMDADLGANVANIFNRVDI